MSELYQKQYNDKYKNIIYNGYPRRWYDETTTDSLEALYSETQIKIIELVEKFNFKIFYISCSAKTFYEINYLDLDLNFIDLNSNDAQTVKNLLGDDMYYLYEHEIFEVLYKIPYLNKKNNYYYNMLILTKNNSFLNKIYNHNFNLINIESVTNINVDQITFIFIQNLFKDKFNFMNIIPSQDKDFYKWEDMTQEYYFKNYCNSDTTKFNTQEYLNVSSYISNKTFNQNLYAKSFFKFLDMNIISWDRHYIIELNDEGSCVSFINIYDMNSSFVTNWAELAGITSVSTNNNCFDIKKENCTYSCLLDNTLDQNICMMGFDRRMVKTGLMDINNLEIYHKNDIWEGMLKKNV